MVEKCPRCGKKLRKVVVRMEEGEKDFFRKTGSEILAEHTDLWQICDSCYFIRHQTMVDKKPIMTSEFTSEAHAKQIH
jgi:ribosomal protein S27AE